jgi:hypothetical protein
MRWLILGMAVVIIGYLWFKNRDTWARTWNRLTPTVKRILIVAFIVSLGFAVWFAARGSLNSRIAKLEKDIAVDKVVIETLDASLTSALKDKDKADKTAKESRNEAERIKKAAEQKTALAYKQRDDAIAKLKGMPSDLLAVGLSVFIAPDFFVAHVDGRFSTTRTGAETTQSKFLDWQARGTEIGNLKTTAAADKTKYDDLNKANGECGTALQACLTKDKAWEELVAKLEKDLRLQRSKTTWANIKGVVEGGAVVYLACRIFPALLGK